MARVLDVTAAWGGLAGDLVKSALKPIAWQAPLTAVLFLVGALALHRAWFGAGGWAGPVPAASGALLLVLFGLAGTAAGAGLALTATARRFLPRLESEVDGLLAPLVAPLVQHALGGDRAVSLERFLGALRDRLAPWDSSAGAARPPLAARWLIAGATGVVRRVLVREFRARRAADGQGPVLAETVERFAREHLLGLVLDRLRSQVRAAHLALLALAAAAVLGPLICLMAGG
jgi:hypothetical protein